MNNKITAPKGTHDILPDSIHIWNFIENTMKDICGRYNYHEIRFPVFENTSLFSRGVGDTTDVVQKEMYTFEDKGGRSITLRPEGTASTVRSYLENNLYANPAPEKLFYKITCYRYERPQAGRYREFNQFGVENFGSSSPYTDAEVISLAMQCLKSVGVKGLKLYINSIGCPDCRNRYNELLKEYLNKHSDTLCELCNERTHRNPLRVLDCKNPECRTVIEKAPTVDLTLCDDCKNHFETLKSALDAINIDYEVEALVRGLDYYTKTVFEIKSDDLGSQSTVCGGGRYDGLIKQLGGESTPGIGFSIGLERLVNIITAQNVEIENKNNITLYIGYIGENAEKQAFTAVYNLRKNGISAEFEHTGRSVKAQMKYANKINAKYTVVLGDDEIKNNLCKVKNMEDGSIIEMKTQDLLGGVFNV